MDDEIPEELLTPPEKRLVQTLITKKPYANSRTVSLGLIFVVTVVSQIYWLNWFDLAFYLPAVKHYIFVEGEIWRAFSSVLIHGDLGHLISNMYMLGILSYFVYGYFGSVMYPVATFFAAGLVNFITIYTYEPYVRLLGASGWVYLLGGFWLTMYLFIQRQHSLKKRMLRTVGMALMVFFPTGFEPTTSYRTHFVGFVVGVILAFIYFYRQREAIRKHEAFVYVS